MKNRKVIKLLDWISKLDFQHYKTEKSYSYIPSGKSHFYLKGSQERFTSKEIKKIYDNTHDDELILFYNTYEDELMERWKDSVAENKDWRKKYIKFYK